MLFERLINNLAAAGARHAATALGGYLVAHGLAEQSDVQPLIGSICFLAGLALSAWDKWQARKKLATAKAS